MKWHYLCLVCGLVCVTLSLGTGTAAAQRVSAAPAAVQPGQPVTVTYSGAPGHKTDWIGIYPVAAPNDRSWLSWQYTEGKGSGTMTFPAPDRPGRYNFRLFKQDGYEVLAVSNIVEVGTAPVPPESGAPVVTASPDPVQPGQTLRVRFSGAPGHPTDWIGIYPAGAPPDRSWLSWQYTAGQKAGTLEFQAPDRPGQYNFRLFTQDGYEVVATSPLVTVVAGAASPIGLNGCWNNCGVQLYQEGERVYFSASWKNAPGEWHPGWVIQRGEGWLRGRDLFLEHVTWPSVLLKGKPQPKTEYHMTLSADGNVLQGYPVINGQKGRPLSWTRDK